MYRSNTFIFIIVITFISTGIFFTANSIANDFPTYQDGELVIPRVDTPGQAGNFQDAMFQFDSQAGTWTLLGFRDMTITPGQGGLFIDQVEIIITNDIPVQVFLKVTGQDGSCGGLGQVNQRLKDNRFEVAMSIAPFPVDQACTADVELFEKIIPLHVYGLPAGIYEYSVVNATDIGIGTGTFTLIENNGVVE